MGKGASRNLLSGFIYELLTEFNDPARLEKNLRLARLGNLLFVCGVGLMWSVSILVHLFGLIQSLWPVHMIGAFLVGVTIVHDMVIQYAHKYYVISGFMARALHYAGMVAFIYVTGGLSSPFFFVLAIHAFTDIFIIHLFYGLFSLALAIGYVSFLVVLQSAHLLPRVSPFQDSLSQTGAYENLVHDLLVTFVFFSILLLGAAAIAFSFWQLRKREKELERANNMLQDYYHHKNLLEIQKERETIAQELHDNLGNDLTHIKLMSELALSHLEKGSEKTRQLLEEIRSCSSENIETMRAFLWVIYPKEQTWGNFFQYLQSMAERQLLPYGIKLRYDCQGEIFPEPKAIMIRFHLLRLVKEALFNIIKYARATEVSLIIRHLPGRLWVSIEDNGPRLDRERTSQGYGIQFMKKRVEEMKGSFSVEPKASGGTKISIDLPLQESIQ